MIDINRELRTVVSIIVMVLMIMSAAVGESPPDWYWGDGRTWRVHNQMIGKPSPRIHVSSWMNGEVTSSDSKGKIIILDFWATWCGPCIRSIPHNNEVYEQYRDKGVLFIGICGSDRQERMPEVVKLHGIRYPVARDSLRRTAARWNIKWWPTYAVIDRENKVRAVGLKPDSLTNILDKLLAEQPPPEESATDQLNEQEIEWLIDQEHDAMSEQDVAVDMSASKPSGQADSIPWVWLEGDAEKRSRLASLECASELPPLQVSRWLSGEPITWEQLKGKVVLIDFWATWSGQSVGNFSVLKSLHDQYGEKDLFIISICHEIESEKAAEMIRTHGITHHVAVDEGMQSGSLFGVDGYPDYYLIDRDGRMKLADIRNHCLIDAVQWCLNGTDNLQSDSDAEHDVSDLEE